MKKSFLLLNLLLVFTLGAQTPRLSLVEEFTGETCPPCAASNPNFNALLSSPTNTPKVVALKWQVPIPSAPTKTWSLYQTNKAEINWRYSSYGYGINSAPSVRIDGQMPTVFGAGGQNVTQMNNAVFATAQSYTSAFSVTMNRAWNKTCTAVTLTISIQATAPFTSVGSLVFRTVMVERNIQFSVQPGSNGETYFEDVAIKSFPTIQLGVPMASTWITGQTQTFTLTCPVPAHTRKKEEIAFVGFIQDDGNRKVAQAVRADKEPIPQDALSGISAQVDLTCSNIITPTVEIKNESALNSITALTITPYIDGLAESPTSWTGNLSPGASTIITLNAITSNAVSGSHTFSCEIDLPVSTYNLIKNNTRATYMVANNYQNTPVAEGFVNAAFPPAGFGAINLDNGPAWSRNIFAGAYNIYPLESVKYDFYNNTVIGDKDELYLPPVDLSAAINARLSFDLAYVQRNENSNDGLEVLISSDCGASWSSIYSAQGGALATAAANSFAYTPDSSNPAHWRSESFDLSAYNQANTLIKFVTTSDNGNNLYLDNINLTMEATGFSSTGISTISARLFPNPAANSAQLQLTTTEAGTAALQVINTLGQVVYERPVRLNAGATQVEINTQNFANGIYQVSLRMANAQLVKTLSVSH